MNETPVVLEKQRRDDDGKRQVGARLEGRGYNVLAQRRRAVLRNRFFLAGGAEQAPREIVDMTRLRIFLMCGFVLTASSAPAQVPTVSKTNPQKIYMHYMPWFESPATLGAGNWGYHWQFNNRDPDIVDANGRRQIASHYYPKIGSYSSRDDDVIEYHLLLMKYAGVDGVLVDWYGVEGTNGDVGSLLQNSNELVGKTDDYGLKFGVVLEDRFSKVSNSNQSPDVNKAIANVAYLKDNYFNQPNYIRLGAGNDPLMLVFGPVTFQNPAQWTQILAAAGEDVNFLTLWYEKNDAGVNADGEYSWIYQDANNHLTYHQDNFDRIRAPTLGTAGGVAYPGFNDYYQEGGTSTVIGFEIPHNNGQTLTDVLAKDTEYAANLDFIQLATFNDYGEGTMFEPTVETGFNYLHQIQQFAGVPYGEAELELVYRLYVARKNNAGNAGVQAQLDTASSHLNNLEVAEAKAILDSIALPGDADGDHDVDGADILKWQQQNGSTGLWPLVSLSGDANLDGVVDAADLTIMNQNLAAPPAGAVGSGLPEPGSALLAVAAGAVVAAARRCQE